MLLTVCNAKKINKKLSLSKLLYTLAFQLPFCTAGMEGQSLSQLRLDVANNPDMSMPLDKKGAEIFCPSSFSRMPRELVPEIVIYLSELDMINFSLVCKSHLQGVVRSAIKSVRKKRKDALKAICANTDIAKFDCPCRFKLTLQDQKLQSIVGLPEIFSSENKLTFPKEFSFQDLKDRRCLGAKIDHNKLTMLDLSDVLQSIPQVEELDVSHNLLKKITVSKLSHMGILKRISARLDHLVNFATVGDSNFYAKNYLRRLDLSNNELEQLDLALLSEKLPQLVFLNAENNKIRIVVFPKFIPIRFIDFGNDVLYQTLSVLLANNPLKNFSIPQKADLRGCNVMWEKDKKLEGQEHLREASQESIVGLAKKEAKLVGLTYLKSGCCRGLLAIGFLVGYIGVVATVSLLAQSVFGFWPTLFIL